MKEESIAIAFAEWIQEKNYHPFLFNKLHWIDQNSNLIAKDTKQLFEIFKEERL